MALQPSPLLRGFEQGADGEDVWNRMMPGEERGPLTLDPQGVALGQQFAAIKAGIEAQQARPIWNPNNRVGEELLQSMGMPQPTTYAGPVGQFIDPATGRMTEQGAARMGNPALGLDTGGLGMIKAYHGSPHAFDAFSDHAIGTGEGAQAYGYGHYLAENEGVARGYRDALTPQTISREGVPFVEKDLDRAFARKVEDATGNARLADTISINVSQALKTGRLGELQTSLEQATHLTPEARQGWKAALDHAAEFNVERAPGHMYEVNVAADPEKFLHWDKPLSEQHPDVRDAAHAALLKSGIDRTMANYIVNNKTGRDLHSTLARGEYRPDLMAPEAGAPGAALALKEAGIPGIRYLDAGSRQLPHQIAQSKQALADRQSQIAEIQADIARNQNNPNLLPRYFAARQEEIAQHRQVIDQIKERMSEGTHNAVVFDPATMEIIRRYGLAGLMGGGGAAALAGGGNRETMTDLATLTAILYAARLQRRVPETTAEKTRAIAESVVDARLIVAATVDEEPDIRSTLARLLEAEPPEQPPPSPGTIGRIAEAKATRRRG